MKPKVSQHVDNNKNGKIRPKPAKKLQMFCCTMLEIILKDIQVRERAKKS